MKLHHFVHQAIDGRFHAVYRHPGCGSLISIGDSACKDGAESMAKEANRLQSLAVSLPSDPFERRIPAGFYADAEAA